MSERQRDAWTIEPLPVDRAGRATIESIEACVERVDGLTESDWSRWTHLRGWKVIDLVWHIARGAARNAELLRHSTEKLGLLPEVSDWGLPHPNDPDPPPATPTLVADLVRALGDLRPLGEDVLVAIFARGPSMTLEHARDDGLQPVAPRGYLLSGDRYDIAFHWNGRWSSGSHPELPAATIKADDTSIARLLVGRATVGEPPQRLGGAWHLALDLPRWCGVW